MSQPGRDQVMKYRNVGTFQIKKQGGPFWRNFLEQARLAEGTHQGSFFWKKSERNEYI